VSIDLKYIRDRLNISKSVRSCNGQIVSVDGWHRNFCFSQHSGYKTLCKLAQLVVLGLLLRIHATTK